MSEPKNGRQGPSPLSEFAQLLRSTVLEPWLRREGFVSSSSREAQDHLEHYVRHLEWVIGKGLEIGGDSARDAIALLFWMRDDLEDERRSTHYCELFNGGQYDATDSYNAFLATIRTTFSDRVCLEAGKLSAAEALRSKSMPSRSQTVTVGFGNLNPLQKRIVTTIHASGRKLQTLDQIKAAAEYTGSDAEFGRAAADLSGMKVIEKVDGHYAARLYPDENPDRHI
jgi:hypothetical protein